MLPDIFARYPTLGSLDSLEGLGPDRSAPAGALRRWRLGRLAHAVYPGLAASVVIGLAASWLAQHYAAPVMLFALLIGMAFHFLHENGRCAAGIEVASRHLLRVGVGLLGARITLEQVASLGGTPVLTVIVGVATTILLGLGLARRFGQSRLLGVLSGGAVAICGASAALAIASILPSRRDAERDTILVVVTVTGLSTLAMILYPLFAAAMGLDHVRAGVFIGGTIHDVAQVVGAGYTISQKTGDVATYVKLLRVAMLAPTVLAITLVQAGQGGGETKRGLRQALPPFLIGFVALVGINSLGLLPRATASLAADASRWCLVTAIAALGMKTALGDLVKVGWRPFALMAIETAWIAALVFCAVRFLM